MASYCTIADLELLPSWEEMQSLTTDQLQNLIDRGARWIRRYTCKDFANETDPDTLADLKWANCLLAEFLFYSDDPDIKESQYMNLESERIGNYQYTTHDSVQDGVKVGVLTGNDELDSILMHLKGSIATGFNYFGVSGPSNKRDCCDSNGGGSGGSSFDEARLDEIEDIAINAFDTAIVAEDTANDALQKAIDAPLVELPQLVANINNATIIEAGQNIVYPYFEGYINKLDNNNFVDYTNDPYKAVVRTGGVYLVYLFNSVAFPFSQTAGGASVSVFNSRTGLMGRFLAFPDPNLPSIDEERFFTNTFEEGDEVQFVVSNQTDDTIAVSVIFRLTMITGNLPREVETP